MDQPDTSAATKLCRCGRTHDVGSAVSPAGSTGRSAQFHNGMNEDLDTSPDRFGSDENDLD